MAEQYLKTVRTRFRNTLTKKNEYASQMLNDLMIAEREGLILTKKHMPIDLKSVWKKSSNTVKS